MKQDWGDLLLAFLHDPPDKALDVRGHVGRACRYASAALDQPISADAIGGLPDQLASIAERVPMPTAGDRGVRAVGPRDDQLTVFHPLSGEPIRLDRRPDRRESGRTGYCGNRFRFG